MYLALCGVAGIAYALIFVLASMHYPGEVLLYGLFTVSAAIMLWLSVRQYVGYGQMFLGIFLWLGIWLKLSVHLISGSDYVEAVGDFKYDPSGYDELLMVATVAHFVICFVWLLAKFYIRSDGTKIQLLPRPGKPVGGASRLKMSPILFFALSVFIINAINWHFGILKIGLVPEAIFIWPTNAVISWLLGDGFPLISGVLLLAAIYNGKCLNIILLLVLLEAILTSITTLSRGVFIWHILPVVSVMWINKHFFSRVIPRWLLWGFAFFLILAFTVSIVAANFTRNYQYALRQSDQPLEFDVEKDLSQVAGLVLDRWIGVEGLMVAVGYLNKSTDFLMDLTIEKNEIGKLLTYQTISESIYIDSDLAIFQTGTTPGAVGFFYLSGSVFLVIVGMFFLGLCVVLIERWTLIMTQNPFIIAGMGLWLANSVAQFGFNPQQWFFSCFVHFCAIFFIAFVQSRWLGVGWFRKFRRVNV